MKLGPQETRGRASHSSALGTSLMHTDGPCLKKKGIRYGERDSMRQNLWHLQCTYVPTHTCGMHTVDTLKRQTNTTYTPTTSNLGIPPFSGHFVIRCHWLLGSKCSFHSGQPNRLRVTVKSRGVFLLSPTHSCRPLPAISN